MRFRYKREKDVCLDVVVEGEMGIKSWFYVTSLDVERIYWREKIKEKLSVKTLKSLLNDNYFSKK